MKSVAIVTGGTSGIGLATARALCSRNVTVYCLSRHPVELEGIAHLVADVSDEEQVFRAVEEIFRREGRIDILMNNYGGTDAKHDHDLLHTTSADFMKIVEGNLRSVYDTCQRAVESMVPTGGGSIVNIASVGGKYPDMYRIGYGVAKSAIRFLTKNIATQYAGAGVRANAILPGFIATDAAMDNMSDEFLDTFLKTVPLGRPGTPEDIAQACLYLASDQSSFVTGEEIEVSGGFGMPSPMYSHYADMASKS